MRACRPALTGRAGLPPPMLPVHFAVHFALSSRRRRVLRAARIGAPAARAPARTAKRILLGVSALTNWEQKGTRPG